MTTAARTRDPEADAHKAAGKARALLEASRPASADHPYLRNKGLVPTSTLLEVDAEVATGIVGPLPSKDGFLQGESFLVAPLYRDGELSSVQLIDGDRRKYFLKGAQLGTWSTEPLTEALGWRDDLRLVLLEGVAKAIAVAASIPGCIGVAAGSATMLPSVGKDLRVRFPSADIVIGGDLGNGSAQAEKAAREIGARIAFPLALDGVKDFDDFRKLAGEAAVAERIAAAVVPEPVADAAVTRPQIIVSTDETAVVDAAIAALAQAPEVYVRGPEIVEIVTDAPTTRGVTRSGPLARIHRSPEPRVRELLSAHARWTSTGRDGESLVDAHPPLWAVRAVVARGHWPAMRPLVGVAEAPTMRPDGTILAEPGYDPATGIYLAPSVGVSIPERPTRDHAVAAASALSDVIADFPVATEAGRSAWIAGVITAAVRPAINGPTPMMIVDASAPGSGKTLSVDAAAIINTGREAARTTYVDDDAEMRKRITAIALVGDPLALLDNVVGTLGCPSLDAALTGTTWRDRVLGSSAMTAELPMRTVWWATGNGLVIGADLVRRALLVRLEPMTERPEERTGWRYPRLVDHVRSVRAELLTAALTIPRAYVVAGSPDQRLTPMGSYTAWSDLVRSAIVWAGMTDPCATIGEIRACDPRADALRGVLDAWPAAPDAPVTVAELLAAATPGTPWRAALTEWCPPRGADPLPPARALGFRLRGVRRRVVAGRYVDAGPHGRGGVPWVLRETGAPTRPGRDDVTTVTMVSRYACDGRVANMEYSGGNNHHNHIVTVDPSAQLAHCLRVRPDTTANDADKLALAEHFSRLNGTATDAGVRLFTYWRTTPCPTVAGFLASEPKTKGGAA